jgi:predicted amidohydrolase
MESDKWFTWTPDGTHTTAFDRVGDGYLQIDLLNDEGNAGKWVYITGADEITPGTVYRFQMEYRIEDTAHNEAVKVMLNFTDAAGTFPQRDFAYPVKNEADGWMILDRTVTAPETAAYFRLELMVCFVPGAKVIFRNASLTAIPSFPQRKVRVAAVYMKYRQEHTFEDNIRVSLDLIDRAATAGAQVILFPEMFMERGLGLTLSQYAEPVPGRLSDIYSQKAKQHGIYVIVNIKEEERGRYYNTNIIFGKQGELAAKYRKTHLPIVEIDQGIRPGHSLDVYALDFGKCGIQICYDSFVPEPARTLALKGAEIIFVSTAGYLELAKVDAMNNGIYLVIAGRDGKYPSRIYSPYGEMRAYAGGPDDDEDGFALADIDLDAPCPQRYWCSFGPSKSDRRYVNRHSRRPGLYV